MRIAIVGSNEFDSLEFHLNESFNYNGFECKIFDFFDNNIFNIKLIGSKFKKLDPVLRKYSEKYELFIQNNIVNYLCEYNPELIIFTYRFINPNFVNNIRKKIGNNTIFIQFNPDALTTFENQQIFATNYDLYFTKDPYIDKFLKNKLKYKSVLYNEAFNQRIHVKPTLVKVDVENELNIDVLSFGNLYPYRCRMLKLLQNSGINLKIYGTKAKYFDKILNNSYEGPAIYGADKSKKLYGAKIIFNNLHYAEIESVNNKFFEINGVGAFQICDYKPILNDLLPIDPKLVSFNSIEEGIDLIKYYLNNPLDRYAISDKIYTYFLSNFTYDHLIKHILKEI